MTSAHFLYILQLADNALIAGHRNSEWTGHGPILEQDIAISNIALDLIGQARNLYQHAATLYNEQVAVCKPLISSPAFQLVQGKIDEDDLAYLRDANEYYNVLLVEETNGDWAKTMLKQFFFSCYQQVLFSELINSTDIQLAAIAEKSLKEVNYHLRWSGEWVIRLGDGTAESHRRMQSAIDSIWKYTGELLQPASYENELIASGIAADLTTLKSSWTAKVEATLSMATIPFPGISWMQQGGKTGVHTEHLGFLLAELQYLQRAYPNSEW